MTVLEINKLKRNAVQKAWLEEKRKIFNNIGQRDWHSYNQRELAKFHRCPTFVAQPLYSNYFNMNNSWAYIQMLDFEFEFIHAHDNLNKNMLYGFYDITDGKVYQGKRNNQIKITSLNPLFKNKRLILIGQTDEYGIIIGNNNKGIKKKVNNYGVERNDG